MFNLQDHRAECAQEDDGSDLGQRQLDDLGCYRTFSRYSDRESATSAKGV
jgi:hypothetical protein